MFNPLFNGAVLYSLEWDMSPNCLPGMSADHWDKSIVSKLLGKLFFTKDHKQMLEKNHDVIK